MGTNSDKIISAVIERRQGFNMVDIGNTDTR